jgi:hypothetical protein
LKLFKGDALDVLVETFSGFTDLSGGGATPEYGAYSSPSATTIANGANAVLPWEFAGDGVELLDLTDPTFPTVITAGVYAVAGYARLLDGPLTAAGIAFGQLSLGDAGVQAFVYGGFNPVGFEQTFNMTGVAVLDAGEVLSVIVINADGVAAHDFRIGAFYVTKIS